MNAGFEKHYTLNNDIHCADLILEIVLAELMRFCGEEEARKLCLGCNELLINAIEHGNLEITYDEKKSALDENRYEHLLLERMSDAGLKNRRTRFSVKVDKESAEFIIEDQGNGFDWKKLFADRPGVRSVRNYNGRGLFIASYYFDSISYNPKGNKVCCYKQFNSEVGDG